MKIVFLTHQYFPRHVGGTEIYTRDLIRYVQAQGHQAFVITCHETGSTELKEVRVERSSYESTPLFELHLNLSHFDPVALNEYDNAAAGDVIGLLLQEITPDIAHVTHAMKLSCAALDACSEASIPTVVTMTDFWFICPKATLLDWEGKICSGPDHDGRKCLPCVTQLHKIEESRSSITALMRRQNRLKESLLRAQKLIALTHFQKETLASNGLPAERIDVIEHGPSRSDLRLSLQPDSNSELMQSPSGAAPARRIGYIGSLVHHKGVHVLLEALRTVPELNMECEIYGALQDGTDYAIMLQEMCKEDKRVVLKGTFDSNRLGQILTSFDLLSMPALWYENGPLVVKAALMMGIPVLASNIGSLSEMIKPGLNGWLAEPGCIKSWAEALRQVAGSPLPRFEPSLIKNAQQNAIELFSIYKELSRL